MTAPLPFDPIAEAARQWDAHWGDDATEAMTAVTSIMRVQQILLARLNDLLAEFDLTFARYETLMLLFYSRSGALPLGKIGARLQVHRTSVTNTVDRLERAGLVSRDAHESDRRMTLATITERGREVARETTGILNEAQFGAEAFNDAELADIARVLTRFRALSGDFVE